MTANPFHLTGEQENRLMMEYIKSIDNLAEQAKGDPSISKEEPL